MGLAALSESPWGFQKNDKGLDEQKPQITLGFHFYRIPQLKERSY
jgi:hypothetical protein